MVNIGMIVSFQSESFAYKIILSYENSFFISDGAPVPTDTVVHEVRKS